MALWKQYIAKNCKLVCPIEPFIFSYNRNNAWSTDMKTLLAPHWIYLGISIIINTGIELHAGVNFVSESWYQHMKLVSGSISSFVDNLLNSVVIIAALQKYMITICQNYFVKYKYISEVRVTNRLTLVCVERKIWFQTLIILLTMQANDKCALVTSPFDRIPERKRYQSRPNFHPASQRRQNPTTRCSTAVFDLIDK